MTATNPIGMIATIETAEVMMIAAEATVHEMMTVEDTSTGTMIATVLVTNATTTMMTDMTVEVDQLLLPETATEVTWIIGTGIGMKDHEVLPVRQKVGANMEGIDQ